jgi:hypothetical protein
MFNYSELEQVAAPYDERLAKAQNEHRASELSAIVEQTRTLRRGAIRHLAWTPRNLRFPVRPVQLR